MERIVSDFLFTCSNSHLQYEKAYRYTITEDKEMQISEYLQFLFIKLNVPLSWQGQL